MKVWMPVIIVVLPVVVGMFTLGKYYREERKAGRARQMFIKREGEGRWGSVLILMGAVMFMVMGNENQWFELQQWAGKLSAVVGVLSIGIAAEGTAWLIGKTNESK